MGEEASAEGLEGLLRSMHEAVLLEDADRRVVFANEAFARLFLHGAPPSVMLGVDCGARARDAARDFLETSAWLERTERIVRDRVEVRGELWQLADGRWVERDYIPRVADGAFAGHAWVYRDISDRELMRQQLADVSTELASTTHRLRDAGGTFDPEGGSTLAAIEAAAGEGTVTVALAKLANLDRLNGEAGRELGDAVIAAVPPRVRAALPPAHIERIGGGTFAITVTGARDADDVIRAIRESVGSTVTVGDRTLLVQLAIGAAASQTPQAASARVLLQRARLALSEARRIGRDLAFDGELVERERRRDQLGLALPAAIRDGELSLVYQPIARLSDRSVVARESLARWTRPGFGTLTAASFVPVAEAMGIARDLDLWVIDRAVAEAPAALALGGSRIGINVSGASMSEPRLIADALERALVTHGRDPGAIVVELTETAAADSSQVRAEMARIADLGVGIAMDDFGVGTSSLAMLTETPFHYIKLDKSFTRDHGDARVRSLVAATCQLAAGFGAQVIAEGLEQEEQVAPLAACGVEFGQGWLVGVPAPLPEAAALS